MPGHQAMSRHKEDILVRDSVLLNLSAGTSVHWRDICRKIFFCLLSKSVRQRIFSVSWSILGRSRAMMSSTCAIISSCCIIKSLWRIINSF
jgi:hypothetical protein